MEANPTLGLLQSARRIAWRTLAGAWLTLPNVSRIIGIDCPQPESLSGCSSMISGGSRTPPAWAYGDANAQSCAAAKVEASARILMPRVERKRAKTVLLVIGFPRCQLRQPYAGDQIAP